MKGVAYIRVSTVRQAQEGISLDAQEAKIRQYCDLKGIELVEVVIYGGISGEKDNREGYQRVLDLCKRDAVDSVICYSLSRFSRSTRSLLDFVDTFLMKKNISLHSF